MRTKAFVAVLLSGCILAIISHIQVPEGCDYPMALRPTLLIIKLLKTMGSLNVRFGGQFSAPFHSFDNAVALELKNTSELEIWTETVGGVECLIFRPMNFGDGDSGSAIIFFHGGGFTVGSAKSHAPQLMKIAIETEMLVIAPEYRLAPEYPFPAAFEDSFAVTKTVLQQAPRYGVNAKKIVLAGDSAGGNLAAAVSLALGQEETPNPICMINLIYPTLQMVNLRLPSYMQNPSAPILDTWFMTTFFLNYIGFGGDIELEPLLRINGHMEGFDQPDILDRVDAKWVPDRFKERQTQEQFELVPVEAYDTFNRNKEKIQKMATDIRLSVLVADDELLKLLPKTHTLTCEFDILRDDGIILHERLKALGKNSTLTNLEFGSHASLNYYGLNAFEKVDNAIDEMLENITNIVRHC